MSGVEVRWRDPSSLNPENKSIIFSLSVGQLSVILHDTTQCLNCKIYRQLWLTDSITIIKLTWSVEMVLEAQRITQQWKSQKEHEDIVKIHQEFLALEVPVCYCHPTVDIITGLIATSAFSSWVPIRSRPWQSAWCGQFKKFEMSA